MLVRTLLVLSVLCACAPEPVSTETTPAKTPEKTPAEPEPSAAALSSTADVHGALKPLLGAHYPDAKVELNDEEYDARFDTQQFTIHGRTKTGRISEQAHAAEGPNNRGFLLHVTLRQGVYRGAAVVPQTLTEPYWRTFINAIPIADRDAYLWVSFAYGQRLNEEFRNQVTALLGRRNGE